MALFPVGTGTQCLSACGEVCLAETEGVKKGEIILSIRLDKFLKLARLIKRRTMAQEMIEHGAVRLEGRECKSSSEVREGNIIEIAYINRVLKVKVLCADEAILKRPKTISWEQLDERQVKPDEKPFS